jgi:hypothetical protein
MTNLLNAATAWIAAHPKVAVAISTLVAAITSAVAQDLTSWWSELGSIAP